MSLKITKADQPIIVQNLTMCLYAPPGLGKTSMAFTAGKPILFDFDKGSHRSQFRKDTVQIDSWAEVEGVNAEDLSPYDTIIIDTAGRALDSLANDLMKKNPKFKGYGGQLSLQGFGALKAGFAGWLNLMRSFGKDVILIAHMDEQRNGDDTVERLDIQGGSKNEIYKLADAMGRIRFDGQRKVLDFNPSASGFGKNPGQLQPVDVPNFTTAPDFLASVVDSIKSALNRQSEEAMAAQSVLMELRDKFQALESPEQFTEAAKDMAKAPDKEKAVLMSIAKSKGFSYDTAEKAFKVAA